MKKKRILYFLYLFLLTSTITVNASQYSVRKSKAEAEAEKETEENKTISDRYYPGTDYLRFEFDKDYNANIQDVAEIHEDGADIYRYTYDDYATLIMLDDIEAFCEKYHIDPSGTLLENGKGMFFHAYENGNITDVDVLMMSIGEFDLIFYDVNDDKYYPGKYNAAYLSKSLYSEFGPHSYFEKMVVTYSKDSIENIDIELYWIGVDDNDMQNRLKWINETISQTLKNQSFTLRKDYDYTDQEEMLKQFKRILDECTKYALRVQGNKNENGVASTEVENKPAPSFEDIINQYSSNTSYFGYLEDNSAFVLDTNPLDDKSDSLIEDSCLKDLQDILKMFGLPDTLFEKIVNTQDVDGKQFEFMDGYTICWSNSSSAGLEVTFLKD